MIRFGALFLALAVVVPALAQEQGATPEQAPRVRAMLAREKAVLQVLDKVSARTTTLRIPVGGTAAFGLMSIKVRSCQIAPPSEAPEAAGFLEISEYETAQLPRSGEIPAGVRPARLLYSGWMFASSPALAALEHPVYDVTVIGCESAQQAAPAQAAAGEEASSSARAAPSTPAEAMPED